MKFLISVTALSLFGAVSLALPTAPGAIAKRTIDPEHFPLNPDEIGRFQAGALDGLGPDDIQALIDAGEIPADTPLNAGSIPGFSSPERRRVTIDPEHFPLNPDEIGRFQAGALDGLGPDDVQALIDAGEIPADTPLNAGSIPGFSSPERRRVTIDPEHFPLNPDEIGRFQAGALDGLGPDDVQALIDAGEIPADTPLNAGSIPGFSSPERRTVTIDPAHFPLNPDEDGNFQAGALDGLGPDDVQALIDAGEIPADTPLNAGSIPGFSTFERR